MLKKKINFLMVIPARYKSKRFPGKPLAKIKGIPMLKRTYIQCLKATDKKNIVIATDDLKIKKYCVENNMPVLMTSKKCLTGTDRIAEIAKKKIFDFYINVQGDEPIFNPLDIISLIKNMYKNPNSVLTGFCAIKDKKLFESKNIPKVIVGNENELLYMSRKPIPNNGLNKKLNIFPLRQVCAYSFPRKLLLKFPQKKKTYLEKLEDIEILRFLELGISVKLVKMSPKSIAVDIPSDILKVEKQI
jgi:3-deoxy-manno-octulosonate cytidylyltransferase (CMP-KDO synthetase)